MANKVTEREMDGFVSPWEIVHMFLGAVFASSCIVFVSTRSQSALSGCMRKWKKMPPALRKQQASGNKTERKHS